jgi:hypothetical protein
MEFGWALLEHELLIIGLLTTVQLEDLNAARMATFQQPLVETALGQLRVRRPQNAKDTVGSQI